MTDLLFRKHLPAPPERLFDVHVNVGRTDQADPSFGRLNGAAYLRLMDASGTARACVFPPQMDHYREANETLAGWAGEHDERLLPFARLGGPRGPAPARETWQWRLKARALFQTREPDVGSLDAYAGIKLIPHMSGLPGADLFDRIAARRLPVLVHAGVHSPPAWIERHVLPKVGGPLILAHLGTFPGDAALLRDAVALARRQPGVYLDTAGVWLANFFRFAAERVPRKLLFGSDAPMTHPLVAWQHLASAVPDDDVLERIAFRNAEALFAPARSTTGS